MFNRLATLSTVNLKSHLQWAGGLPQTRGTRQRIFLRLPNDMGVQKTLRVGYIIFAGNLICSDSVCRVTYMPEPSWSWPINILHACAKSVLYACRLCGSHVTNVHVYAFISWARTLRIVIVNLTAELLNPSTGHQLIHERCVESYGVGRRVFNGRVRFPENQRR